MPEFFEENYASINFYNHPLNKGEFESCTFKNCDFSHTDLSEFRFIDCIFSACNLSLAKLFKTSFQDTQLKDCKLLGLHFEQCSGFGLSFRFENCQLAHSSFFGIKLKGIIFKNCDLQEVDFTDADLTSVAFENCNLLNAVFENCLLQKADFRTAFNYSFDPERNRIKGARFSLPAVTGLLDKYGIQVS